MRALSTCSTCAHGICILALAGILAIVTRQGSQGPRRRFEPDDVQHISPRQQGLTRSALDRITTFVGASVYTVHTNASTPWARGLMRGHTKHESTVSDADSAAVSCQFVAHVASDPIPPWHAPSAPQALLLLLHTPCPKLRLPTAITIHWTNNMGSYAFIQQLLRPAPPRGITMTYTSPSEHTQCSTQSLRSSATASNKQSAGACMRPSARTTRRS